LSERQFQPTAATVAGWSVILNGHRHSTKSDWILRWDLSPLGYLSTAAHGHANALHFHLVKERAM